VDELIVVSRAIHFLAMALLFGIPLFRLAIVPDGSRRGAPGGRAIELWACAAALLSGVGWFVGVAGTMAGSWSDALAPDIVATVALDTRFGRLWLARLAGLLAIGAIQAAAKPSRAKDVALAVVAAGFAASLVGVGHGLAGSDKVAPFHAAADIVHLVCAATWIGGLFCLGQVLRAGLTGDAPAAVVREVLPRFSRIGYWAVGLLLISGCVNALVLVPSPDKLLSTDYGRVLLVKIALALAMVAIAVVNRIALTPDVAAPDSSTGLQALWRSVVLEQAVGLAVLATVARLGTIHPVP
jgi:putative copper resistance protein D